MVFCTYFYFIDSTREEKVRMDMCLEGKTILVTGGGSGIGKASSIALAKKGANVIIADNNVRCGKETSNLILKDKGKADFYETDVSNANSVRNLMNSIVESYGRLDYAFNNAGTEGAVVPTAEYSEEDWDHVINVNLKGIWLCMKYEILQMQMQNYGIIVNMASVHGLRGNRKNMSAYTASKFGIVGLTQTAALEYENKGIMINSICPGAIRTPMQERLKASKEQLKRMSPPEEIALIITWLFSNSSLHITGQALTDRQWELLMQKNSHNRAAGTK